MAMQVLLCKCKEIPEQHIPLKWNFTQGRVYEVLERSAGDLITLIGDDGDTYTMPVGLFNICFTRIGPDPDRMLCGNDVITHKVGFENRETLTQGKTYKVVGGNFFTGYSDGVIVLDNYGLEYTDIMGPDTPLKLTYAGQHRRYFRCVDTVKRPACITGGHSERFTQGLVYELQVKTTCCSGSKQCSCPGGVRDIPEMVDFVFINNDGKPHTLCLRDVKEVFVPLSLPSNGTALDWTKKATTDPAKAFKEGGVVSTAQEDCVVGEKVILKEYIFNPGPYNEPCKNLDIADNTRAFVCVKDVDWVIEEKPTLAFTRGVIYFEHIDKPNYPTATAVLVDNEGDAFSWSKEGFDKHFIEVSNFTGMEIELEMPQDQDTSELLFGPAAEDYFKRMAVQHYMSAWEAINNSACAEPTEIAEDMARYELYQELFWHNRCYDTPDPIDAAIQAKIKEFKTNAETARVKQVFDDAGKALDDFSKAVEQDPFFISYTLSNLVREET